jgi:hypothetical protein
MKQLLDIVLGTFLPVTALAPAAGAVEKPPIKIVKYGPIVQNTVIETYPAVSQFWEYNPEEYLKQRLSTRDNPPCKHC